jgi:hypothetical protein
MVLSHVPLSSVSSSYTPNVWRLRILFLLGTAIGIESVTISSLVQHGVREYDLGVDSVRRKSNRDLDIDRLPPIVMIEVQSPH